MLCQFCGKNHATNKFFVNFMGFDSEVYICDECMENFKQYNGMPQGQQINLAAGRQPQGSMPAWPMGFTNGPRERKSGSGSFDVDGLAEMRTKRRLNQLHKQLKDSINAENYEEAAILRDKINDIKKEVFINGK